MSEADVLKNMVMSFRVSELTMLLSFAGRSRSGRKTELQSRALELTKLRSAPINAKVRELYRSIQQQTAMAMGQSPPELPSSAAYLPSSSRTGSSSQMSPSKSGYSAADIERAALQARNQSYSTGLSGYAPAYSAKSTIPSSPSFPIHPDVRLKKLPFFDSLAELLRPSSLVPQGNSRYHDSNFVFHLTPQQATDIASSRDARPGSKIDFVNQIQIRFCLLETSCEQEDNFPSNLAVKVNTKMVTLPNPIPTNKPGVEPKRPPRPVNITSLCRLSPTVANQINVTWASDLGGRGYVMAVYLVRRLSSSDLLQRLRSKGVRPAEYTRGLIKDKLCEDADMEIATTSLKVSLVCPLGKMKMQLPCRATSCSHLQCFDASLFLQMNERKPTWVCPVCDKPILYDHLAIDGYFSDILCSSILPSDSMEVQLNVDGTWTILTAKKETTNGRNTPSKSAVNVDFIEELPINKSDPKIETIDETELELVCEGPPPKKRAPMVVDLTLSSDSEDDIRAPPVPSNRIRSTGSQSSRPSTADSVGNASNGIVNLSSSTNNTTGSSSSSSASSSTMPGNNLSSFDPVTSAGLNGVSADYSYSRYLNSGSLGFSSPSYYPYGSSSSTSNGQNPYHHPGYSPYVSYGGSSDLQNLMGNGLESRSLMSGSLSMTSTPLQSSNANSSGNSYRRSAPSPPDVISLD